MALSQTLTGTATHAACRMTCRWLCPVLPCWGAAVPKGDSTLRPKPPTDGVCVLKEHTCGQSTAFTGAFAAKGPEPPPPQGHPFGRSVLTPQSAVSRNPQCCEQGGQRRCRKGLKLTMNTPHRSSEDDSHLCTDRHEQDTQRPRTATATPAATLMGRPCMRMQQFAYSSSKPRSRQNYSIPSFA